MMNALRFQISEREGQTRCETWEVFIVRRWRVIGWKRKSCLNRTDRHHAGREVMCLLHPDLPKTSCCERRARTPQRQRITRSVLVSISLDYLIGNQITAPIRGYYLSKFAHLQHGEFIRDLLKTASSPLSTTVFLWSHCLVCRQLAVLFVSAQLP